MSYCRKRTRNYNLQSDDLILSWSARPSWWFFVQMSRFPNETLLIERYCMAWVGIIFVKIFSDSSISGTKSTSRWGLADVIGSRRFTRRRRWWSWFRFPLPNFSWWEIKVNYRPPLSQLPCMAKPVISDFLLAWNDPSFRLVFWRSWSWWSAFIFEIQSYFMLRHLLTSLDFKHD